MSDQFDDDEDYYCRDCGLGGLLCSCDDGPVLPEDDDPRDYNPESDPRKYDQGRDE